MYYCSVSWLAEMFLQMFLLLSALSPWIINIFICFHCYVFVFIVMILCVSVFIDSSIERIIALDCCVSLSLSRSWICVCVCVCVLEFHPNPRRYSNLCVCVRVCVLEFYEKPKAIICVCVCARALSPWIVNILFSLLLFFIFQCILM